MDAKLLLQKLQEIKDQLPEDLKSLVIIKTEEIPEGEESIDPKLQKIINIIKNLSDDERAIVLDKCECTDG